MKIATGDKKGSNTVAELKRLNTSSKRRRTDETRGLCPRELYEWNTPTHDMHTP